MAKIEIVRRNQALFHLEEWEPSIMRLEQ